MSLPLTTFFADLPDPRMGTANKLHKLVGLRIGELLAIKKEDLKLDGGKLITRWDDSKADRDEIIPLHPVVIEHLRKIAGDDPLVFPWPHDPRTLWSEFTRIQGEAGIHLVCREKHEHTPSCHVYGFHDFRRAFATVNAPRLKPEVLQRLVRHKSCSVFRAQE